MSPRERSAARDEPPPDLSPPESPPEVSAPVFIREIDPQEYSKRQIRNVVNDVVSGRMGKPGVIANLRAALNKADGRTAVLTITYK